MLGIRLGWPNFKWCNVQWSCQTIIPKLLGKSWDLTNTNGDVTRSNYAKCRTKQYWAVFFESLGMLFFLFFCFFRFSRVFFVFSRFFWFSPRGPPQRVLEYCFFFCFLEVFCFFLVFSVLSSFFWFSPRGPPQRVLEYCFFLFSPIFLLTFSPRPSPDSIFEKLII